MERHDNMTNKQMETRCKQLTMGCWWTSRSYPKTKPRWDMITSELRLLADYPGASEEFPVLINFADKMANG